MKVNSKNLPILLQLQLIPDMIILVYLLTMDFRNWSEDQHKKNYKMKVIHSIGTTNILMSSISLVILHKAITKENLFLAAFYTRLKGITFILSIPIEALYLNDADNADVIQTNPSAESLSQRQGIMTLYYILFTLHVICLYKYQRMLISQKTYQSISLKRYLEGIYVKYWIYMDCLGNIHLFVSTIVHLHNTFSTHRETAGNYYVFAFDTLGDILQYSAAFFATYCVFKRDKNKLQYSFLMRFTALIMYMLNVTILGGEQDKTLHRAVLTRGVIPEKYSKIFCTLFWLPLIRVNSVMILVCLREFIEQLQDEENACCNALPTDLLYISETNGGLNSKVWESRLRTLEINDQKMIKLCNLNPQFLKIDPSNCLGSGEFGPVYKGYIEMGLFLKQDVAIKMARVQMDDDYASCLLEEFKKLTFIGNHKNIVRFYGFFQLPISYFGNLGVVMEYCSIGSMLSYLQRMRYQNLPKSSIGDDLNRFAYETAEGLEYLSTKQVIHGDVACRNLLLCGNKSVKITDFGMSLKLHNYEKFALSNQQQMFPWKWMSPEAMVDLKLSIQSDIWSYGVLLWEIFTLGLVPYPECSWNSNFLNELKIGRRLEKPDLACNEMFHMMESCWQYDPRARITFTEIIKCFERRNLFRGFHEFPT